MNNLKTLSMRYLLVAISLPVQALLLNYAAKGVSLEEIMSHANLFGILIFMVATLALMLGMFMFSTTALSQKERLLDTGPTLLGVLGCLSILAHDGSLWRLAIGAVFVAFCVIQALAGRLREIVVKAPQH
jgi:hypothetical protein